MPNGKCIINELDFEKQIQDMPDRQLLEFVARQNYETSMRCQRHDMRITNLETGSKKQSGIVGAVSGTITAIIVGIIGYFTNRN